MTEPTPLEKRVQAAALAVNSRTAQQRERGLRLLASLDGLNQEILRHRAEEARLRAENAKLRHAHLQASQLLDKLLQVIEAQDPDDSLLEVETKTSALTSQFSQVPAPAAVPAKSPETTPNPRQTAPQMAPAAAAAPVTPAAPAAPAASAAPTGPAASGLPRPLAHRSSAALPSYRPGSVSPPGPAARPPLAPTTVPALTAPALTAPTTASAGSAIKTETEAVEARSEAPRVSPPKPGSSVAVYADLPPDKTVNTTAAGPDRAKTDQPAPKAPEYGAAKPVKRGNDAIGGIMTRIDLAMRHKAASGEAPTETEADPATDTPPSSATPSSATKDRDQDAVSPESDAAATPPHGETIAEIMARVAEQVYSSHEAAARKVASETAGSRLGTSQAGSIGPERVTDGPAEPQDLTPRASLA